VNIEHKSYDLAIKADDSVDNGGFEAYFASFGNVDRGGDVIEKGAFRNVDEFKSSGWIALNHDRAALPIAYPVSVDQDDKGLLIVGRYHSHPAAQAVRTVNRERIEAGKSVMGSIGYRTIKAEKGERDGKAIRSIKSLAVYECSFVNLPMNPAATTVQSKGLTLDGLGEYLGLLVEEEKAGRTVSRENHEKLKALHAKLGEAHSELNEFLVAHDPSAIRAEDGSHDPSKSDADPMQAYLKSLALCAKYTPLTP
jgi:HK97 family phage prohead protease